MKSVIMNLTLLSLLVFTDAWFLNLGKSKSTQPVEDVTPSASNARKVILVAKKVYVPMYASDEAASAVADRLLPISPAVMTPSEVDGRQQQQQQMIAYPPMYLPPPAASYAMYAPANSPPVVVDSALPQYATYPAAGEQPQYVQFGVAPSQAMMYLTGDGVAAAPYYSTDIGQGTVAEESAVPSEVKA